MRSLQQDTAADGPIRLVRLVVVLPGGPVVDLAKHRPRDAVSLRDQSLGLRIAAFGFMVEQAGCREFGLKVEHRVVQAADQRKHPHRERHVPLVFRTRTPRKQASVHPGRMFNQHCLAVRKVGHNLTTIEVPI